MNGIAVLVTVFVAVTGVLVDGEEACMMKRHTRMLIGFVSFLPPGKEVLQT